NSKAVITGDITQIDLPSGKSSGLIEAEHVVSNIPGIAIVHFDESDVVRHPLVQRIIVAYDSYENGRSGGRPNGRGAVSGPASPRPRGVAPVDEEPVPE